MKLELGGKIKVERINSYEELRSLIFVAEKRASDFPFLYIYFIYLSVPPGARVKSQMTPSECKKTSDVTNLRIHIETAINRINTVRIFKNVLYIPMLHHMDDIFLSCAAL